MSKYTSKTKNPLVLAPLAGTVVFLCLYIVAAFLYPGGSQADKNSKGFSWLNNYWCNLLNENAINGQHNPGRPVALTATFILCFALSLFWYHYPRYYIFGKATRLVIQLSGILAMVATAFLFTGFHDFIINISGALGVIALVGTFAGLFREKNYTLFWFGIFNLLLIIVNNYVYYSRGLIVHLPVIQKISFLSFLIWICCIDVKLYNKEKLK